MRAFHYPKPKALKLPSAKATIKQTGDGTKVHSFQTLPGDRATVFKNQNAPKDKKLGAFDMMTTPTAMQQRASDLLGVTIRLN